MSTESSAGARTRRNASLDLLRGLAVLMVVLVHCREEARGVGPGLAWFAERCGELGVPLFFMVSGYTMMLTFGGTIDSGAVRSFYIRRVFRIVPLFWLAIVFYLLLSKGEGIKHFAPDGVSLRDVLLTFSFMHWTSVTAYNSVVPGGWSIAVEMQFYLVFPLLLYLFRRPNGPIRCYALFALVSIVGQLAADHYVTPWLAASLPGSQAYLADGISTSWLPRQAICFAFGILLYDYIELKRRPAIGTLLLLAASLFSTWGAEIAVLAAIAFLILASNASVSWIALLGRHSYAIYLIHFAVISAIVAISPIGLVPLFLLASVASLAFSYYLIEPRIERHFNRLGHALAAAGRETKPIVATTSWTTR
jgi:exopolysaccharide production protein ExoZ